MSNRDAKIKYITYHQNRQYFTEFDPRSDNEKKSSFKIKEKKEKVIINGKATIVILDDGTKGIAKCCPDDTFNEITGIKIAFIRAKIKSLKKELETLTK